MKYINFEDINVNPDWCFKNVRSVEQWTHGYHRYPAKFLPNIVKKLIENYATNNETIADLFAGCGTTLVEAKIHGITSIGTDINPVAQLITKVKTNPICPTLLEDIFKHLIESFSLFNVDRYKNIELHERIDYWFRQEEKEKIAFLYEQVVGINNENLIDFFLVCLSHTLKNCSRWLQSSTKPQIDPNKKISEPFHAFEFHCKKMIAKNAEFYKELQHNEFINTPCEIKLEDARNTSIESGSIGTIITSPPYVTSYEYADIHQLTGYWYDYFTDLRAFRREFIGTFYSSNQNKQTNSKLGQKIVCELARKDDRMACEVANYFNDMEVVGKEMYRILKKGGHACIVIGNTTYKDVKIKSAEVFFEILKLVGLKKETVIKRSIPHKLMPTIRDKNTGKFTKLDNANSKLVYPEEYILVVKK
ncbi:DNA methylase [Bacteroidales bacterium Barb6]|nr:DNA methylase [Bacteroidales bacterium Barb6]